MRLLFVCPGLPYPARKGAALRTWALLRHLAPRHELALIAFADEPPEPPLGAICRPIVTVPAPHRRGVHRLLTVAGSLRPDMAWRLRSERFQAALNELVRHERFDAVLYESLEMAPFHRREHGVPAVLDELNAEFLLQRRACLNDARSPRRWHAAGYSLLQWLKLRRWEALTARHFDRVVAVSAEDAAALARIGVPGAAVVTNGVEAADYAAVWASRRDRTAFPPVVLFIGTLDFRPNVDAATWFVRDILPTVRAARADVRCQLVGASPAEAVRRLAAEPGVELVGPVPDVRPYLAEAAVFAVPMRIGGGVRLKVPEAMAAGVPLVTTAMGAEGIPLPAGAAELAESPADFAAAVLRLLADPTQASSQAAIAHDFGVTRYDWANIVPELETVLLDLVARRGLAHVRR